MGLSIDIAVEHEPWRALGDLDILADRAVAAAVAASGEDVADGAEVSVVLCDDAFIRDLNARWRAKDKPTNVLSFPTDAAASEYALGDVVVAWETSSREAEEQGVAMPDYLTHLLIHGVMHLLGYDHETDAEAEEMEGAESRALATLGIASPYDLHLHEDQTAPAP